MTDLCEEEYLCYRGVISNTQYFHMVATGVSSTDESSYYVLCSNSYTNSNGNKTHRLYFSRDPYDYIPSYTGDSKNDGAAFLKYSNNNNNFELKYLSKNYSHLGDYDVDLNSKLFNIHSTDFNNLDSDKVDTNIVFSFIPDKNIDNEVYAGTKYSITTAFNTTTNQIKWYYKKDTETEDSVNIRDLIDSKVYTDSNNFVKSISGTSCYSFSSIHNDIGTSTLTPIWSGTSPVISNLPHSGKIGFKIGTNKYYYTYNYKINDTNTNIGCSIIYNKILGDQEFNSGETASGGSICFFNENTNNNYENVSDISKLKFYLIPSAEHSFFSNSLNLKYLPKIGSQFVNNFIYKNPLKNGFDLVNKAIPFIVNKQINRTTKSIPTIFTDKDNLFNKNIPYLASSYKNTNEDLPYLIWTTNYDSSTGYFYPYCDTSKVCGDCMGIGQGERNCHVDNYTRNYLLEENTEEIPLTVDNRDNIVEKKSNSGLSKIELIILIVAGVIMFIVILTFIIIAVKHHKQSPDEKPGDIELQDFSNRRDINNEGIQETDLDNPTGTGQTPQTIQTTDTGQPPPTIQPPQTIQTTDTGQPQEMKIKGEITLEPKT